MSKQSSWLYFVVKKEAIMYKKINNNTPPQYTQI